MTETEVKGAGGIGTDRNW